MTQFQFVIIIRLIKAKLKQIVIIVILLNASFISVRTGVLPNLNCKSRRLASGNTYTDANRIGIFVLGTYFLSYSNLSFTKYGTSTASSGEIIAYTLIIRNSGLLAVGVKIRDIMPAQLSGVIWDSSVYGGAVISSGASGNINDVQLIATIPAKASIAVMITGKIDQLFTGSLVNKATLTQVDSAIPVMNSEKTTTVKKMSKYE